MAPMDESSTPPADEQPQPGISRRGLLGLVGAASAAGLAAGGAAGGGLAAGAIAHGAQTTYPFYGSHQGGITTPTQDRLHFAAFDMAAGSSREDLIELLNDWTIAASRMTQGLDVSETGAIDGPALAPPDDTGEALDLHANGLTITFGFGPTLFRNGDSEDRFGIADRAPALLNRLPRFAGDSLSASSGDGDLCIQACSDDPQVAVHAIRNLSRIAFGRASIRWSQLGFGRTSSTSTSQVTPRNLFGFKDGTANIKAEHTAAVEADVWVGSTDGPAWLAGGSYLVARKIRMVIESWDRTSLQEQERVVGRSKGEGAPLSGGSEFSEPLFNATGAAGQPLIDSDSHVRLAHSSSTGGATLLRRSYNYVDGNDELGRLDAGLFFISFQRSPQQFIDVQRSLSIDALNEYIKHVGSAIFAVPAGPTAGEPIGAALFL
jgi:deferrochelatase/peroxidase EfeB